MKKQQVIQGNNYSAIQVGNIHDIANYTLIHPKTGAELHKIFLKDKIGFTGMEISFQSLAAHEELPYFHTHIKNEEAYIILKGKGKFQVDNNCFDIEEGSVIRVSTPGKRSLANISDSEMVYMVIQTKEGSLEEYSGEDGRLAEVEKRW
ncbi:MAG: cupin domain-containing protein [Candidatus Azobacteroides sp.]|nr:cupin domain-containing protein [Candidatus Azobacteroides sp.]